MRRYISICFLWAISIALWGQSNVGYGGDYDPANPENPKEPSVTMKYHLKVTAGKGGSANIESSAREFTAGTSVYLYAMSTNRSTSHFCRIVKSNIIFLPKNY